MHAATYLKMLPEKYHEARLARATHDAYCIGLPCHAQRARGALIANQLTNKYDASFAICRLRHYAILSYRLFILDDSL